MNSCTSATSDVSLQMLPENSATTIETDESVSPGSNASASMGCRKVKICLGGQTLALVLGCGFVGVVGGAIYYAVNSTVLCPDRVSEVPANPYYNCSDPFIAKEQADLNRHEIGEFISTGFVLGIATGVVLAGLNALRHVAAKVDFSGCGQCLYRSISSRIVAREPTQTTADTEPCIVVASSDPCRKRFQ